MNSYTLRVTPNTKPRMTKSDRWKRRPCVMQYWAFKDQVKAEAERLGIPSFERCVLIFMIPMPKSWSKKKKKEHLGQPHKKKPDSDNLTKALKDALMDEDEAVWDERALKFWAPENGGSITIITTEHERIPLWVRERVQAECGGEPV